MKAIHGLMIHRWKVDSMADDSQMDHQIDRWLMITSSGEIHWLDGKLIDYNY